MVAWCSSMQAVSTLPLLGREDLELQLIVIVVVVGCANGWAGGLHRICLQILGISIVAQMPLDMAAFGLIATTRHPPVNSQFRLVSGATRPLRTFTPLWSWVARACKSKRKRRGKGKKGKKKERKRKEKGKKKERKRKEKKEKGKKEKNLASTILNPRKRSAWCVVK